MRRKEKYERRHKKPRENFTSLLFLKGHVMLKTIRYVMSKDIPRQTESVRFLKNKMTA